VPLFTDGESPRKAVLRAQGALEAQLGGGLDVLLLGLGEDGHIASLFPGREWPEDGLVARVRDSPKPPANRITLTVGMLATAQASVLVAVGEGKRDALARLRAGDPALPASGLAGLHVVTDQPIDDPAPTEERSG
jgi:6-phosphogluconolactonase